MWFCTIRASPDAHDILMVARFVRTGYAPLVLVGIVRATLSYVWLYFHVFSSSIIHRKYFYPSKLKQARKLEVGFLLNAM